MNTDQDDDAGSARTGIGPDVTKYQLTLIWPVLLRGSPGCGGNTPPLQQWIDQHCQLPQQDV